MSIWEETAGQTCDKLESLYPSALLVTPWDLLGGDIGRGWGEKCLGSLAEDAIPATQTQIRGWKKDHVHNLTSVTNPS